MSYTQEEVLRILFDSIKNSSKALRVELTEGLENIIYNHLDSAYKCGVSEGINASYVKVKLTDLGWEMYKEKNGFWESNVDEDGYSTFSYNYFEELFFPIPYKDFADDVKFFRKGE